MLRRTSPVAALALALTAVSFAPDARAEESKVESYAVIIGANTSVDAELAPLRHADDDAARYRDLFRAVGVHTRVLSRFDDNTKRLHPEAAAEAHLPTDAELTLAVAAVAKDAADARAKGSSVVVYFVYAGHGNTRDGRGYLTLEDARITGADLAAKFVDKIPADRFHIIVDACESYFLAYGRGPGGTRHTLRGFRDVPRLADDPRVGLILSTSSARESHEWDAFQAGVFSHEIRSGLYGAADADGDGKISYRELGAFVTRANLAIPNEKYRPDVHVRPPKDDDIVLDVRAAIGARRIVVDGAHAAHYFVEDARGVRLLDAHNATGQSISFVAPSGPLYLRRATRIGEAEQDEFFIAGDAAVVAVASLTATPPHARSRGAAHEAFSLVFQLPFDRSVVAAYDLEDPWAHASSRAPDALPEGRRPKALRSLGWASLVLGAVSVGAGAAMFGAGAATKSSTSPSADQATVSGRNRTIEALNTGGSASVVAGGVFAATGAVLLLWPVPARKAPAAIAPSAGGFVFMTSF